MTWAKIISFAVDIGLGASTVYYVVIGNIIFKDTKVNRLALISEEKYTP